MKNFSLTGWCNLKLFLAWGIMLIFCSTVWADIPKLINFQGILRDGVGNPVPNDTVNVEFKIYDDPVSSTNVKWSETQPVITGAGGEFNVTLGLSNSLVDTAFTGTNRWLGIRITTEISEMTPRVRLVSVPYTYEFDDTGPDSIVLVSPPSPGAAFLGKVIGSFPSFLMGLSGVAENSSSGSAVGVSGAGSNTIGEAYGGLFGASGTGANYGIYSQGAGASSSPAFGVYGLAYNISSGQATGGIFTALGGETGIRTGVRGNASNSSSATSYGVYGQADNSSTGEAYGGFFNVPFSAGDGNHYGVWGSSFGLSGSVYGGYFYTDETGIGTKYGVYATAPPAEGYAGFFVGDVRISDSLIVLGGKSAAVKVNDGEYRLLYSQESPECWFEDFGEAELINGKTVVQIDPLFAQTVNTSVKYHVFLTPQEEPLTLAVKNKTVSFFEVVGPAGSNISFSYRIVAKRKGFENLRLSKMGGPTPEEVALEQTKHQAQLEKNKIQTEQENRQMPLER